MAFVGMKLGVLSSGKFWQLFYIFKVAFDKFTWHNTADAHFFSLLHEHARTHTQGIELAVA